MPIYLSHGNRADADLPPVWPFMAAPLSRQTTGHLPWVLLALLESLPKGRETAQAAEGITDAHTDPRATNGCRCDSVIARVQEKTRLPDNAERPKLCL